MTKKQKVFRLIVSGSLLAAVVLVGLTVFQVETNQQEQIAKEESRQKQEEEKKNSNATVIGSDAEEEPETTIEPEAEDTAATDVIDPAAQNPVEEVAAADTAAEETNASAEAASADAAETEATQAEPAIPEGPVINFTESSLMQWPLEGDILMDYSMDHTVHFETLDVYKYNPAIVVSAVVGEPVLAAANSRIVSIEENVETGTTVTADMGNGYLAVYGQLKDVAVAVEDTVEAGTVLGYVNDPTKYYTMEGSNLYFSMEHDGEILDPIVYLP
ncbi:MAG: M23 family metallopeptidase [Lachnospiraceae bacterium]|nr:M23 family metallopeptidase [Lachnospiraceae bacterium]